MFDHVYCLQPSAADNPWLNKLFATPPGSEEECPHLFINDVLVPMRGYRLPKKERGSVHLWQITSYFLQIWSQRCSVSGAALEAGNTSSQSLHSLDPIKWIKYRAANEKEHCQVFNCCPVQHRLTTLLWHLRELGGVRKNDNRFVSVKELSYGPENSSASLSKAQRKIFACLATLERISLLGWKSDSSLLSTSATC